MRPPFREYHFIDLNGARVENLQRLAQGGQKIFVYEGDCNDILVEKIFPTLKYETYRRALCLLDPYGLNLKWDVISRAGQLGTVDMFLNFPVMGLNRNVLWRNPERLSADRIALMNSFWGGEWRDAAYSTTGNLFGIPEKEPNEAIAEAFRQRLIKVAGFKRVPEPMPMRNSIGNTIYYLFFASQVGVAEDIVNDIFSKYRRRGIGHQ